MSVKRIDIAEFRSEGYLQEVNRRFLHPLGLALEIVIDDDTGESSLGGVWDYRDDPEGIVFDLGDGALVEHAERIDRYWSEREPARRAALGFYVQGVNDQAPPA